MVGVERMNQSSSIAFQIIHYSYNETAKIILNLISLIVYLCNKKLAIIVLPPQSLIHYRNPEFTINSFLMLFLLFFSYCSC